MTLLYLHNSSSCCLPSHAWSCVTFSSIMLYSPFISIPVVSWHIIQSFFFLLSPRLLLFCLLNVTSCCPPLHKPFPWSSHDRFPAVSTSLVCQALSPEYPLSHLCASPVFTQESSSNSTHQMCCNTGLHYFCHIWLKDSDRNASWKKLITSTIFFPCWKIWK